MRRFFVLLWRLSRNDLRLLWFAVRHPARPGWLIPSAVLLGLYMLSPLNFVIPMLGVVDDFVIVPLLLHSLLSLLPQSLKDSFEQKSSAEAAATVRHRSTS